MTMIQARLRDENDLLEFLQSLPHQHWRSYSRQKQEAYIDLLDYMSSFFNQSQTNFFLKNARPSGITKNILTKKTRLSLIERFTRQSRAEMTAHFFMEGLFGLNQMGFFWHEFSPSQQSVMLSQLISLAPFFTHSHLSKLLKCISDWTMHPDQLKLIKGPTFNVIWQFLPHLNHEDLFNLLFVLRCFKFRRAINSQFTLKLLSVLESHLSFYGPSQFADLILMSQILNIKWDLMSLSFKCNLLWYAAGLSSLFDVIDLQNLLLGLGAINVDWKDLCEFLEPSLVTQFVTHQTELDKKIYVNIFYGLGLVNATWSDLNGLIRELLKRKIFTTFEGLNQKQAYRLVIGISILDYPISLCELQQLESIIAYSPQNLSSKQSHALDRAYDQIRKRLLPLTESKILNPVIENDNMLCY
ncbi:MAG: hypothetical protein CMF42_04160 [Legionellales bacterium]|nr:hypothetical protein [Legionellales bacterium]OUX67538.1 MAG: hypothetical protein CBD38_02540 [bacterium TMED178]